VSFAECALLQDQNQSLIKINKEAKVRRSTRSVVLGKAKVMSFEDLEEARAKRAAKEKSSLGKVKSGRKRKVPVLETGAAGLVVQMSEAPEPWRAPVARMY
jgi:hypothetical protein